MLQVTAFDLMPGAATVYRADALALGVGPPGSDAQVVPPADAADGAGRLLALPAGSFHVAVLSLVLSYIPDPLHRTQARPHRPLRRYACVRPLTGGSRLAMQVVLLARRLLCDQAGLLLLVTPLSTDRCALWRPCGTREGGWHDLLTCFYTPLLAGVTVPNVRCLS